MPLLLHRPTAKSDNKNIRFVSYNSPAESDADLLNSLRAYPFFSSKGQWKSFMSHWPVAATKCCLRATICMQRIFPQPPVIRRKSGTGGAKKSGQMTGPIKPDKGPWNTRRGPRWLSPLSRTGSLAGLGLDGSQCPHLHTYCVYMHTKFVPAWCYWKLPLHLELAKRAVLCLSPKSKKKIIIKIKL